MLSVGMEMPGVEAEHLAACDGVTEVEFVRANGATLRADAEEFSFHGVEVVRRRKRFLENFIERRRQSLTGREAVGRRVLEAVGNPDVGDARRAECAPHRRADLA